MKRIVCGAVLACVSVAPAHALDPEVNLSGLFGLGFSYHSDQNTGADFSDLALENNASNFRITAAAHEVGIRAFIAYERGASNDRAGVEDVREFFGGVSGAYGTLLYGRKATDYRLAGERLDPFYNTSLAGNRGNFASEGAGFGLSGFTNGFTSNTIAYRAPAWHGLAANLATFINDNNSQGGDRADYGAGLSYARSDWTNLEVGVQGLEMRGGVVSQSPGPSRAYRAHGSINGSLWATGLSYEWVDIDAEAQARQYAFLSGTWQAFETLRFAASYGNARQTPSADGNGVTAGAFWDLMKNLSVYGGGRWVKLSNGTQDRVFTGAAGVKFVFDVDL